MESFVSNRQKISKVDGISIKLFFKMYPKCKEMEKPLFWKIELER